MNVAVPNHASHERQSQNEIGVPFVTSCMNPKFLRDAATINRLKKGQGPQGPMFEAYPTSSLTVDTRVQKTGRNLIHSLIWGLGALGFRVWGT